MLNVVASYAWDLGGYVELEVDNSNTSGPTRRRVSRIATLDGSAVFNDAGYTEADRTIELSWNSALQSATADADIDRLVRTYTRVVVVTRSGAYLASPETFTQGAPDSRLTLLIVSKLSS
jgi:hypothetical protein